MCMCILGPLAIIYHQSTSWWWDPQAGGTIAILWHEIIGPMASARELTSQSSLLCEVSVYSLVPSCHPYDNSFRPFRPTFSTNASLTTPANIELPIFWPYITLTFGVTQLSTGELCLSNCLLVPLKTAHVSHGKPPINTYRMTELRILGPTEPSRRHPGETFGFSSWSRRSLSPNPKEATMLLPPGRPSSWKWWSERSTYVAQDQKHPRHWTENPLWVLSDF